MGSGSHSYVPPLPKGPAGPRPASKSKPKAVQNRVGAASEDVAQQRPESPQTGPVEGQHASLPMNVEPVAVPGVSSAPTKSVGIAVTPAAAATVATIKSAAQANASAVLAARQAQLQARTLAAAQAAAQAKQAVATAGATSTATAPQQAAKPQPQVC